ncbi:MAG: dUTP diphosphatase [Myxococcota bacterium]
MSHVSVQVRQLRPDAVVPRYMTEGAAGLDLSAAIDQPLPLAPGQRQAVPTGLALAIPTGYEGQVRPRSGAALKTGLTVLNAPGTIDSDYRGEVAVILINLGSEPLTIQPGQRIAQLVIAPVTRAELTVVTELPPSQRGGGGFGSTGQ